MLVLNKLITWLVELPVLPPWWWTRPGFFQDSAQIWGAVVGRFYVFWCDNYFWLVVWNINFMNFHILGISSSQLTFIFFQSGRYTTNQLFMCLDLIPDDKRQYIRWFWVQDGLMVLSTGGGRGFLPPLPPGAPFWSCAGSRDLICSCETACKNSQWLKNRASQ